MRRYNLDTNIVLIGIQIARMPMRLGPRDRGINKIGRRKETRERERERGEVDRVLKQMLLLGIIV